MVPTANSVRYRYAEPSSSRATAVGQVWHLRPDVMPGRASLHRQSFDHPEINQYVDLRTGHRLRCEERINLRLRPAIPVP